MEPQMLWSGTTNSMVMKLCKHNINHVRILLRMPQELMTSQFCDDVTTISRMSRPTYDIPHLLQIALTPEQKMIF